MLNGMKISKARKACFKIMHTANDKSLYSDLGWNGPHQIMDAMSKAGLDFNLVEAKYFNEDKAKIWRMKINFINDKGVEKFFNADITAFCAGTVEYPWRQYDITITVF